MRKSSTLLQSEEESGCDLQEDEVMRGKYQTARLPVLPRPFRLGEGIQADWVPEEAHLRADEAVFLGDEAGDGREDRLGQGFEMAKRVDCILGKLSSKAETAIVNSPKAGFSLVLLLEVGGGVLRSFCCYASPRRSVTASDGK